MEGQREHLVEFGEVVFGQGGPSCLERLATNVKRDPVVHTQS